MEVDHRVPHIVGSKCILKLTKTFHFRLSNFVPHLYLEASIIMVGSFVRWLIPSVFYNVHDQVVQV